MPNPRKHSGKRDTDVAAWEWPVATRDLMRDFGRLEAAHKAEEIRRDVFSLIAARKALGDAILALGAAKRHQVQKRTTDRLESLKSALEREMERFPLTVVN